ncbi:MAG TPA: hypothetical protein VGK67_11290 [Myxococcales bacterium]|jgi:hypothetical protein
MLDFNRQDETLREQVGSDSMQILHAANATWADRFHLAREHMAELATEAAPTPEMVLERDRLASFFGCAFGRDGLLAKTGLLLSLRDRLQRIAVLGPRLVTDPAGMSRLRRDAVLAGSFAKARLGRSKLDVDRALLDAVRGASQTAMACADFVCSAGALSADRGGFLTPGKILALSDLGFIAADTSTQRPLIAAGAFLLSRWAHALEQKESDGLYDALVDSHLAALRDALWAAAEAQLSATGAAVPLPALEAADRELEGLVGRLSDRTLHSAARAGLIAELFALATSGRALFAQRLAESALDSTLKLTGDALLAETGASP